MGSRHVALLRGINVGKAKRVAMADLRTLIEDLGCRDVRTLLNSGNVAFTASRDASDLGPRIAKALEAKLGVSSRVTVLSDKELAQAVTSNPLAKNEENPSRFLVAFLASPADRQRLTALVKHNWAPEAFALGKRVAYLWCANGILESQLLTAISRAVGDGVTTRNWATVLKLHALAQTV